MPGGRRAGEKALAARADEDRPAERGEARRVAQAAEELEILPTQLAETESRVEHDLLPAAAGGERASEHGGEARTDLLDEPPARSGRPERSRRFRDPPLVRRPWALEDALMVHQHHWTAGARGERCGLRVFEARYVVEEVGAGVEGRAGHQSLAGVDGDRNRALPPQARKHWQQARELLASLDLLRARAVDAAAGTGRLGPQVDEIGALLDQTEGLVDGALRGEEPATVAERVRRDVDDTHEARPARHELELLPAREREAERSGWGGLGDHLLGATLPPASLTERRRPSQGRIGRNAGRSAGRRAGAPCQRRQAGVASGLRAGPEAGRPEAGPVGLSAPGGVSCAGGAASGRGRGIGSSCSPVISAIAA